MLHLEMYVFFVYSQAMQLKSSRDKNHWHIFETIFLDLFKVLRLLFIFTHIHLHEHEHEYPFVMMIMMSGNVNNLSSKYLLSNV